MLHLHRRTCLLPKQNYDCIFRTDTILFPLPDVPAAWCGPGGVEQRYCFRLCFQTYSLAVV